MRFHEIKARMKKMTHDPDQPKIRLAFVANFTLPSIGDAMRVLCHEVGIEAEVYEVPYGMHLQETLDSASGLITFAPNIIFLAWEGSKFLEKLYSSPYLMTADERSAYRDGQMGVFNMVLSSLKEHTKANIVVNSYRTPSYSSRGILEAKEQEGMRALIRSCNAALEGLAQDDPRLWVLDLDAVAAEKGRFDDEKMFYHADMCWSFDAIIWMAERYMAYVFPAVSATKKVIALDLDNTLWGGIVGEVGREGIRLGPEKEGRPFIDMQSKLLGLHERGVLLAVCSKNNEEDVLDVFRNHPSMILKEKHVSVMKVNWDDKAMNLRAIADDLNVGLDSMVFIDDDPANREQVRKMLPEVMVVDVPDDPVMFPTMIEDLQCFETFTLTAEDRQRSTRIHEEKIRQVSKERFADMKEFIRDLKVIVTVREADPFTIPRIAQLTQRTNQFNLTTERYTEEDIRHCHEKGEHVIRCFEVADRFGSYGITGTWILEKTTGRIDIFLLSCRAIGREVEAGMLEELKREAKKTGLKQLRGEYVPTKKNVVARSFFEERGFKKEGMQWVLHDLDPMKIDVEVHRDG
ncbi:MAG: HAD-IIIC family phosphatase [Nanoarchaeota archaeon]